MVEVAVVAEAGQDQIATVGIPADLHATSFGGGGNHQILWEVASGPDTDSNQLGSVAAYTTTFTPSTAGTYTLKFTADDGLHTPGSDTLTVVAYDPVVAQVGPNQVTFIDVPVALRGTALGGDGSYVLSWVVRSGPDSDSDQFSSTSTSETGLHPTRRRDLCRRVHRGR